MHVLALEPFDGGSHRAFLDGWLAHSAHRFTRLSLPAKFWKWRMRHAAATLADQVDDTYDPDDPPEAIFAGSMLNLAEFRGLAPRRIAQAPSVLYFHENQLAYPDPRARERDRHFTLTNITSGLAAEAVWFNSEFNRDSFLDRIPRFLQQMPTRHMRDAGERIRAKAAVHPPGIELLDKGPTQPGPLRIAWVGRWEHDKNPEDFFAAMQQLKQQGVDFRLSVLGEQAIRWPEIFDQARHPLADRIDHWGYQADPADYAAALQAADVVVSTAWHEFFGLAIMEACSAGCFPLLPSRVVYPELFTDDAFFYDGSVDGLARRLVELAERKQRGDLWRGEPDRARDVAAQYAWPNVAARLDAALMQMVEA